jgi:hypothetical protein
VNQISINLLKEQAVHLALIIFSLFFTTSILASDWKSIVRQSMEGKAELSQLESIKDLDTQLKLALKSAGPDEQLALTAIRGLRREALIDELKSQLKLLDLATPRGSSYFVTLSALADTKRGREIVGDLNKKIDLTNIRESAGLKLSLLSAMIAAETPPSEKLLNVILEDPSYELRLKVMEIIEGEPAKYLDALTKALITTPYPVRLKAADAIARLPLSQKEKFRSQIEACAKNDQNESVRAACKNVKF